jgi:hypothetical protein
MLVWVVDIVPITFIILLIAFCAWLTGDISPSTSRNGFEKLRSERRVKKVHNEPKVQVQARETNAGIPGNQCQDADNNRSWWTQEQERTSVYRIG